ncbi:hypothetical protein [Cupriavidus sp. a3]|uniref:hypothetical protein n=1 Tax=Cupriavidus sp. a3 TaxID=3242158 RepID=UPI003D9C2003
MPHFMTGPELKLQLAGQDDAFAKAAAMLDAGEIGPHRFWWLATQFAIDALTGKPATVPEPGQQDLFSAATP